jgi:hypothetical protein
MSPPNSFYNLPFVLAYATLDQVLDQLITEGHVKVGGKRPLLGTKMAASSSTVPWKDYATVDAGKEKRNELAHKAKLLPPKECPEYISAIEVELKAWKVLQRDDETHQLGISLE